MTGLTNGYVIPRLPSYVRVPGVRVEPKGHGNALAVLVARARAPPSGDRHGDCWTGSSCCHTSMLLNWQTNLAKRCCIL